MIEKLSGPDLVELFLSKTISYGPTDFIEVGCFEGSASKRISKELPSCNVTAYEANPENYDHFKNDLSEYNINHIQKGVSNYNGEATFYRRELPTKKKVGNNSLMQRVDNRYYANEVKIECVTLDEAHYSEDKTFSIWIDAEGHAFQVLQGADKVLSKTKYVFIEVEGIQFWKDQKLDSDIVDYLSRKGFIPVKRDTEMGDRQYNILFENGEMND